MSIQNLPPKEVDKEAIITTAYHYAFLQILLT